MESTKPPSVASQFSIKRLFWTLIVASLIFKLADATGVIDFVIQSWTTSRDSQRVAIAMSIIASSLIAIGYIAWIGIRLPFLFEKYFEIRKKREARRKQFKQELETWQQKMDR
jgi:hypothetical protein